MKKITETTCLIWKATGNPIAPYYTHVDNKRLIVRIGDFPDESLYSIMDGEQCLFEIDDWPEQWLRPLSPKEEEFPNPLSNVSIQELLDNLRTNLNKFGSQHFDKLAKLWNLPLEKA